MLLVGGRLYFVRREIYSWSPAKVEQVLPTSAVNLHTLALLALRSPDCPSIPCPTPPACPTCQKTCPANLNVPSTVVIAKNANGDEVPVAIPIVPVDDVGYIMWLWYLALILLVALCGAEVANKFWQRTRTARQRPQRRENILLETAM